MRLDNAVLFTVVLMIAVMSTATIAIKPATAEIVTPLSGVLTAAPSTVTVGHSITVSFNVTNTGTTRANNTVPTVLSKTGTGSASCTTSTPPSANITSGSYHVFTFNCLANTAGSVTFSSSAVSGSVSTGIKSSNPVTIQPAPPTVTITKRIVGGTATLANFTLMLDGHSVTNGTATAVTAGQQQNVSESFSASLTYLSSFSGDCNPSGIINATKVINGTSLECKITNTFSPPTITVIKHIVGGSATLANFTLIVNGNAVTNGTANTISLGKQQNVSETFSPSSLANQYSASFSGDCNANGVINATRVFTGSNLECIVTNTFHAPPPVAPTVSVIKHIVGGTAKLANFTLMLDGNSVSNGTAASVVAGQQQNISEVFSPISLSSEYTASFAGDCNINGVINATKVVAGASLECTMTNTFNPPTVTVIEHIVGGSATLANFTLMLDGSAVTNGTVANVRAGQQQNVSESFSPTTLASQYTASFSGDCTPLTGATNSAAIAASKVVKGASLVCTITNTIISQHLPAPTVAIIKHIIGGTATLANFTLILDGHAVTNDTATTVIEGRQQNVTEVFASSTLNYVATFAGDCDGRGIITADKVVNGANLECTITNTFTPPPTVTIVKHIVGGTATLANFTLVLDGHNVANGTATNVTSGLQQNVSETFNPSSLSSHYVSSFTGDCNSAGIISANNVVNGASLECTITNTFFTSPPPAPTVTIIKYIVGGTATLSNVHLWLDGNTATNGTSNTVIAGQQQNITESLSPSELANQYSSAYSGDCSPNGTIGAAAVKPGANLDCIITNTFVPPGPSSFDCSNAIPSQSVIWPPNHKYVAITILDVAPNGSPVTITITSIHQNERVSGHSADGTGLTTSTAHIRADKSGDARVYRIGFTAIDSSGNSCTGFVIVVVPHDHSGNQLPPADTPTPYDSTIASQQRHDNENGDERGDGNNNENENANNVSNDNGNSNGHGHSHSTGHSHGNSKGNREKHKDN